MPPRPSPPSPSPAAPAAQQSSSRCPARAYERLQGTRCAGRYLDSKCKVRCPGMPPRPSPPPPPSSSGRRCPDGAYKLLNAIRCLGKKELNAKCRVKCTPPPKKPQTKQPPAKQPTKKPRFTKQPLQHSQQSPSSSSSYVQFSPGTSTTFVSPGYTTFSGMPHSSSASPGRFNHQAFRASFPAWMRPHL